MGHESREDLPDLASEHDVGEAVHVGRAGVDDDDASAGGLRRRHAVGGRVDAERRADGQQEVALLADLQRPLDDLRHQRLTERDGVALEDAAALEARRILLAGPDPLERLGHRPAVVATPAPCPPHRAVDLDHQLDVGAGLLVQAVDVLGDDGVQLAPALQLDDRVVATVRLGPPPGIGSAVAPGLPADVGIGEVVLERRRLLGAGFLVQTPCGPRKSGMPESVEIPAPVRTVIRSASSIHPRTVSRSSTSESVTSQVSPRVFRFGRFGTPMRGTDLLHAPTDPTREVP